MPSDKSISSTGSPALRHRTLKPPSPRKVIRREAFLQSESSSASSGRADDKASGGQRTTLDRSSRTQSVFVESPSLADGMLGQDNAEDPHDLSFSSKHFPRASMVDNLVLSLDQLTTIPTTTRASDRNATRTPRRHAPSRSVASDGEIRSSSRPSTSARVGSGDPVKDYKEGGQLAAILGDDEASYRAKMYTAQRAIQSSTLKSKQQNQHRPTTRSRSSSNSSSVDLGHLALYAGRLGAAGNRRSQSFDFGSSQRSKAVMGHDTVLSPPELLAGLELRSSSKEPLPNQTVVRRNSGISTSNAARSNKRRSGTMGASTLKLNSDSQQALPFVSAKTSDISDRRQTPEPHVGQLSTPRPGFFRRVFGSSRNVGNATSTPSNLASSPMRPSQDRSASATGHVRPSSPGKLQRIPIKSTADATHDKENRPVVTKKPSSFFRRRKRSVSSNTLPPSLPLNINSKIPTSGENGASSPVSSLRAFMDPYLIDSNVPEPEGHKRGTSLQSVQNAEDSIPEPANVVESRREFGFDSREANRNRHFITTTTTSATVTTTTTVRHVRHASANLPRLQIPGSESTMADASSTDEKRRLDDVSPLSKTSLKPDFESRSISSLSNKDDITLQRQRSPTPNLAESLPAVPADSESSQGVRIAHPQPERRQTNQSGISVTVPPSTAASEMSVYKSAPSTPILGDALPRQATKSPHPHVHVSQPSVSQDLEDEDVRQARKIYDTPDDMIGGSTASAWLGEGGIERERMRMLYMALFDWTGKNVLASLRSLCSRLALKGETQQVDRILDAFARRWCECNRTHGFVSLDVVHTISYSILLLNTDLHLADIGQKMTRTQFVRNAMDPIKQAANDHELLPQPNFLSIRSASYGTTSPASQKMTADRDVRSPSASSSRPTERLVREDSNDTETLTGYGGPLVDTPYVGSRAGWELQIEVVLKDFYTSISKDPLPLFGQPLKVGLQPGNNLLGLSSLRRTPSTISKARSDHSRNDVVGKSLGARFNSRTRSRVRLGSSHQGFGSSRTSLDDGSSAWSPMSSTWSKTSLGKNLTSMSVDSFATEQSGGDYQSSIGFANALSQAIIRDENLDLENEDGIKAGAILEDESLELYGAPWAKEGILKHKCHLEGVDKRSRDRNWNDCFAVIEKGWMRLFSFSMTAKSLRHKAKNQKPGAGGVVGGGNWQDNAEEVWKFMLRHTIASSLPPPGYSKQRPYVWALSLPNGAVHLFSVGTPDIVKEFVSTANFWSARLSKEPMTGGVSSMEYGWGDTVINRALISSEGLTTNVSGAPRPSTQMSMRSSIDHGGNFRPRLAGDKVHISDWQPPQQSLLPSQLMEVDQIKNLQSYVKTIEDELQRHNELRGPMLMAFSSRHPNSSKAMSNWEKKSSYLLREIVKFGTYIEALKSAQGVKVKVQKMKKEDEDAKRDEIAERAYRHVNEERD